MDDAPGTVTQFIEGSRARGHHGGFLAVLGGEIAGSAMCCLLRSPYPEVIRPEARCRGYIWSVYTVPAHRGQGVGQGPDGARREPFENHRLQTSRPPRFRCRRIDV